MPTSPSASWVAECAACHHSNPARAHFCSVCGAPLQSPAAAAAAIRAAEAGAQPAADTLSPEPPEPQGFMLHFNEDDSLAIAPRYTSPDTGDADTAAAAAVPGAGVARTQPQAEIRFALPGLKPQASPPAATPASSINWSNAVVAGAMLAITALVGTGSYLLGRSSIALSLPRADYQAAATAPAAVQTTALHAGAAQAGAIQSSTNDSVTQALALADAATGRAAVAPLAPVLPATPQAATAPATTLAQATPASHTPPAAAPVPGVIAPAAGAARAPAAMPCNATVAALGLCEP